MASFSSVVPSSKVVITVEDAGNLAILEEKVFDSSSSFSRTSKLLASISISLSILYDCSGY